MPRIAPRTLAGVAIATAAAALIGTATASATTLLDYGRSGGAEIDINRVINVPGWKIRGAKRVIAVMVARTKEVDVTGAQIDSVPTDLEGQVKVVCTGWRGGIAQRTVQFAAEGDGQNGSVIRLPGYTGYGCAFRFTAVSVWVPNGNSLVEHWAGVRIETA